MQRQPYHLSKGFKIPQSWIKPLIYFQISNSLFPSRIISSQIKHCTEKKVIDQNSVISWYHINSKIFFKHTATNNPSTILRCEPCWHGQVITSHSSPYEVITYPCHKHLISQLPLPFYSFLLMISKFVNKTSMTNSINSFILSTVSDTNSPYDFQPIS